MRSVISFQPIPVLIDGHDIEGSLVLHDGQLVAVLARLDGESYDPEFKPGLGRARRSGRQCSRTLIKPHNGLRFAWRRTRARASKGFQTLRN